MEKLLNMPKMGTNYKHLAIVATVISCSYDLKHMLGIVRNVTAIYMNI